MVIPGYFEFVAGCGATPSQGSSNSTAGGGSSPVPRQLSSLTFGTVQFTGVLISVGSISMLISSGHSSIAVGGVLSFTVRSTEWLNWCHADISSPSGKLNGFEKSSISMYFISYVPGTRPADVVIAESASES